MIKNVAIDQQYLIIMANLGYLAKELIMCQLNSSSYAQCGKMVPNLWQVYR